MARMMTARRLSMEARFSDTRSANISSATIWLVYAYERGGEGMLSSRNIHTMPAGGWQRRGKLDGGGEKLDGGVWLEGGGGVPGTGV